VGIKSLITLLENLLKNARCGLQIETFADIRTRNRFAYSLRELALILVKFWFNLRFNINPRFGGVWLTGGLMFSSRLKELKTL